MGPSGKPLSPRRVEAVAFKAGSFLLVVALAGVMGTIYTTPARRIWGNGLMLASIGLLAVAVVCFGKATWRRTVHPGRPMAFPDVTAVITGYRCQAGPDGSMVHEFGVDFTNNHPIRKVALVARYLGTLKIEDSDGRPETTSFDVDRPVPA